MKIKTDSGTVSGNGKSHYMKWLSGYVSSGAFSGINTLKMLWDEYGVVKPNGCSWYAWGYICGRYFVE